MEVEVLADFSSKPCGATAAQRLRATLRTDSCDYSISNLNSAAVMRYKFVSPRQSGRRWDLLMGGIDGPTTVQVNDTRTQLSQAGILCQKSMK